MKNILSIDVEDYFMVSAFSGIIPFESWGRYESRIEKNTTLILSLLKKYNTKATFFVLGWIGERYPSLIKEIVREGHEIACHGYAHKLIYLQTREEFTEDIRKSKKILEHIISQPVIGYRAPSFSITVRSEWALDCLIEEGYRYDSSVFPIRHARGGIPHAKRFPYRIIRKDKKIWEIPLSTIRLFGRNLPIAGGGYFRLFPYKFTEMGIRRVNAGKNPVIVYLHPWEFDPDQPRILTKGINRFRHYVNLHTTEYKLENLLKQFEFGPIRALFREI